MESVGRMMRCAEEVSRNQSKSYQTPPDCVGGRKGFLNTRRTPTGGDTVTVESHICRWFCDAGIAFRTSFAFAALARWVVVAVVLVSSGAAAVAEPRVPPPDFETNYQLPPTQSPPASGAVWQYVDIVLLACWLGAAAASVLKLRNRWAVLALAAAALVYFGFVRKGCVCSVGSVQNIALAAADSTYAVPLVVIAFFLLPLIAALLWGRVFCGGVCPLGAIQELFALRPIQVPRHLAEALGLLRYVYLAVAVVLATSGGVFLICRYDPFVAMFRMSGQAHMLVLGACMLVIGIFVARPYCRFFCPYGVLLGWASRLSWKRITITPDECIQCRLCEDSCPYGAIDIANADAPRQGRAMGRRLLVALIVAAGLLVAGGGYLGRLSGPALSRAAPQVQLAQRIADEEAGIEKEFDDASKAFRNTGRTFRELYDEAAAIEARFDVGTMLAGGFLGLIVGLKLIALSVRRRRTDYEANRANCVACGRCFARCPIELKRRGVAPPEAGP